MAWNEAYNFQNTFEVTTTPTRILNLPKRYRPGSGDLLVFLNGVLARKDLDYKEVNGYTIEFVDDLIQGDVVFYQLQKLW